MQGVAHVGGVVAVEAEAKPPILPEDVQADAAPAARREALVGIRGPAHVRTKLHPEHANSPTARRYRHGR